MCMETSNRAFLCRGLRTVCGNGDVHSYVRVLLSLQSDRIANQSEKRFCTELRPPHSLDSEDLDFFDGVIAPVNDFDPPNEFHFHRPTRCVLLSSFAYCCGIDF